MSQGGYGTPARGGAGHEVIISDVRKERRVAMTMRVVHPVRLDVLTDFLTHAGVESRYDDDIWVSRRCMVGGRSGRGRGARTEKVKEQPEKSYASHGIFGNSLEDLSSAMWLARVGSGVGGRVWRWHGGLPRVGELHGGHV